MNAEEQLNFAFIPNASDKGSNLGISVIEIEEILPQNHA